MREVTAPKAAGGAVAITPKNGASSRSTPHAHRTLIRSRSIVTRSPLRICNTGGSAELRYPQWTLWGDADSRYSLDIDRSGCELSRNMAMHASCNKRPQDVQPRPPAGEIAVDGPAAIRAIR